MSINTIRELDSFGNWGNDRILACAVDLPDAQLDRPFEMGPGTLRETLRHLYGAERNWYERVGAPGWESFPRPTSLSSVAELSDASAGLARHRAAWLANLAAPDLKREYTYSFATGPAYTSRLDDILLHVCNHGIHHRAQVMNMLRRLQAPTPKFGADYIFMYIETPDRLWPAVDLDGVRRVAAYSDWASLQVVDAAAGLTDAQLDQTFEMGLGTLRRTLLHVHDAWRWWLGSWINGPVALFPAMDESMSPARLRELLPQTTQQRDEYFATRTDADLRQSTAALVRPGDIRRFPLGVTMLQVCCHGTHHRAQALNMLRRLGAPVPELDWIDWTLAV